MATQLTTTEIATELDTDPRTLRKFLRADAKERNIPAPGKGSRWSIEKREMRSLRSRFAKWTKAQDDARAARDAAADAENDAPDATDADDATDD